MIDLNFNYEEALSKNTSYKIEDLTELKQWVKEQPSSSLIPNDIHEKQLLLFYNACLMNLNDTKKCISNYYRMRDGLPEYFTSRHFDDDLMKETAKTIQCFVFPDKTDEGYDVFFLRFQDLNPETFHPAHIHKLMFMTIDAFLYENGPPQAGFVIMFDVNGVRFGHMKRISFSLLRKFFQYLHEAIPVYLKAIYLVNSNTILDKILSFIRPFAKSGIFQKMCVHRNGDDYNKFFENSITKKCIPPDFGGQSMDPKILHSDNCEKLKLLKTYFDSEESYRNSYRKK